MTGRPDRHGSSERPAGASGATPGAAAPGFRAAGPLRDSNVSRVGDVAWAPEGDGARRQPQRPLPVAPTRSTSGGADAVLVGWARPRGRRTRLHLGVDCLRPGRGRGADTPSHGSAASGAAGSRIRYRPAPV